MKTKRNLIHLNKLLLTALLLAAGFTMGWAQTPVLLPTNCVAWWRAEGNANDSVGANNGALMNGATSAAGKVGQGFSFDGADDFVEVPTATDLNLASGQGWAMEGWIKPEALTGTQFLAHKGSDISGVNPYWGIYLSPDVLRFEMTPSSGINTYTTVISSGVLLAGQWQHVAVVVDAVGGPISGYHLYINGSDAGISYSHQGIAGGVSTAEPLRLGTAKAFAGNLVLFFKGQMDEPSIYNRALSAAEIAAIYAAGSAGKVPSSGTGPSIASQPQSRTSVLGTTATFSVTATGDAPLSYQWRKGGTPLANIGNISGTTSNVLTIASVQFTNAGNYDVVVTNFYGSVTSSPAASLTVTPAVAGISLNALARIYNGAAQIVTATTTPPSLAYAVTYGGSPTPPTNAGSYAVVATITDTNYTGSTNGTLVVDKATVTITFGPLPPKVMGDPPFTLNASVGGTVLLSGYSSQNTNVARVSGNTVTIMGVGSTLITASYPGDINHYSAADVSQTLTVSGVGALITQPPSSQVVGLGANATFTVTATGTGPLHYQWYFNNVAIGGANGASLTLSNAAPGAVGIYQVTVWNVAGTNTSAAVSLGLDALKLYAGVNAYGPVGSNYVVQYATNLAAPVNWLLLQSVTIVTNPTVIIDYNSPDQPKRFYRTVPQ